MGAAGGTNQLLDQIVAQQNQIRNYGYNDYIRSNCINEAMQGREKPKEQSFMDLIKGYFVKHRDLFMGLAIAIVLDRYLLDGAFQGRLKRIINGILDKTENTLAVSHDPKE
jgi:hypothetical protein